MPVHHFDMKDIGEETMRWWQEPYGSTLMLDPVEMVKGPKITPMEQELTELRRRFARQQVFLLLFTCVLGATAFIATGLSLYLYLLTSG